MFTALCGRKKRGIKKDKLGKMKIERRFFYYFIFVIEKLCSLRIKSIKIVEHEIY